MPRRGAFQHPAPRAAGNALRPLRRRQEVGSGAAVFGRHRDAWLGGRWPLCLVLRPRVDAVACVEGRRRRVEPPAQRRQGLPERQLQAWTWLFRPMCAPYVRAEAQATATARALALLQTRYQVAKHAGWSAVSIFAGFSRRAASPWPAGGIPDRCANRPIRSSNCSCWKLWQVRLSTSKRSPRRRSLGEQRAGRRRSQKLGYRPRWVRCRRAK
jgi:hypothetical protein